MLKRRRHHLRGPGRRAEALDRPVYEDVPVVGCGGVRPMALPRYEKGSPLCHARVRSAWTELKIGILALVAIAIAASVIFLVSGEGGFFWQRYTLKAKFDNVAGLKTGAPVRVAGVEVGSVKGVAFNGTEVEVTFELSKRDAAPHHDQSIAVIGVGVAARRGVARHRRRRHDGTPVPEYGYVPSRRTPGQLADVGRGRDQGPRAGDAADQGHPRGQGHRRQAVHRRGALSRRRRASSTRRRAWRRTCGRAAARSGQLLNNDGAYRNLDASLENLQADDRRGSTRARAAWASC